MVGVVHRYVMSEMRMIVAASPFWNLWIFSVGARGCDDTEPGAGQMAIADKVFEKEKGVKRFFQTTLCE